jgi:hypothetical protein
MSDTRKSLHNTADQKLTFTRIAIEKLLLPDELFDERVPINEESLSLFLPIIVYNKNSVFMIIDGCKRFKVLAAQGQKEFACGIVEPALDSASAGLLRIRLNSNRHLHAREKLLFIGWLKSHFDEKAFHEQVEKFLGSAQNLHANECHEYEQLLACNTWLIEAVMRGTLDPTVAPEMNHLSETDAGALLNLFSTLSFSRQMQRELAEWLPEIAFIRKISLTDVLASLPFASILSDKKLNNPQKITGIHDLAHDIRLPLYSQAKKAWTQQARQINPDPSKVTLQASPYFEKDSLEIRIKTGRAEEIHRIIRQLASIDLVKWQELIDPTARIIPPRSDNRHNEKQPGS